MISLPPDEATRDCPVESEFENKIVEARKKCDMPEQDEYYYYEYEEIEENYNDNDANQYQYEDLKHMFRSNMNDIFDDEDAFINEIEYDYQFSDNCTTFYDGAWATVAGWGATYKFDGSCILRHAKKKIYPNHHSLCLDESDYVMEQDRAPFFAASCS